MCMGCLCVFERPASEPTRKFILFPSVLGQIPTSSTYFGHSGPRIYGKGKCSDVSDTSLLKLANPPHNFDFLYTVYRQLREILNTENINFTPAKALSKDVLGWQIVTFMWEEIVTVNECFESIQQRIWFVSWKLQWFSLNKNEQELIADLCVKCEAPLNLTSYAVSVFKSCLLFFCSFKTISLDN